MGNNCTCSERNKKEYESVFKDYQPVEKRSNGRMFFDEVSFDIKTPKDDRYSLKSDKSPEVFLKVGLSRIT